MKTIQMTIDEELLRQLDSAAQKIKTSRSAFIRDSVLLYLKRMQIEEWEKQQRQGYEKFPVTSEEFGPWEDEQVWGD